MKTSLQILLQHLRGPYVIAASIENPPFRPQYIWFLLLNYHFECAHFYKIYGVWKGRLQLMQILGLVDAAVVFIWYEISNFIQIGTSHVCHFRILVSIIWPLYWNRVTDVISKKYRKVASRSTSRLVAPPKRSKV